MVNTALLPYLKKQKRPLGATPVAGAQSASSVPFTLTTGPSVGRPQTPTPMKPQPSPLPLTPNHPMQSMFDWGGAIGGGITGFLTGGPTGAAVGAIGGGFFGDGETTADKAAKAQADAAAAQAANAAALLKTYGNPNLDAMMLQLGFVKDASGNWVGGPTGPYDEKELTREMVGTRDTLEPEMQRQIALANEQLAGRGLDRSSLTGGVQASMRGDFVKALAKKRLEMIRQLTAERWSKIMNVIAASQGQAGAATQGANATLNASIAASNQANKTKEQNDAYWDQIGDWIAAQANKSDGTEWYTDTSDIPVGSVVVE